jgi:transposase
MAPPQKEKLRSIGADEQICLERLSRAGSQRMDRVRRASALVSVAQGKSFAHAAHQAGFKSGSTVAALVARFNTQGLKALTIAPGRGRKPSYDSTARARIVATAQRLPNRKVDGTATWSLSTLERTLRREAFPQLGATTIRRMLERAGSSYQRTRTWCPTGTAQRKRKAGVVTVVDPQTEEKRGRSNRRIAVRRQPGSPYGAKMRLVRTRRSRSLAQVGSRKDILRGSHKSISEAARPSC